MNELTSGPRMSGRMMKLVAGGVSLAVLAVLAVLTSGFLADDPEPPSPTGPTVNSTSSTERDSGSVAAVSSGDPALHSAIAMGDSELVRILVEGGADVDRRDVFGDPAPSLGHCHRRQRAGAPSR